MEVLFGTEMQEVFDRFIASQPLSPEVCFFLNTRRDIATPNAMDVVTGPSAHHPDYFFAKFYGLTQAQCFVLGIAWSKWVANSPSLAAAPH